MPFKHTPGPHHVDPNFPGDVESSKGTIAVAVLRSQGFQSNPGNLTIANISVEEASANAKLFARASVLADLLEELRKDPGLPARLAGKIDAALEGL